jgi:plastocyanin
MMQIKHIYPLYRFLRNFGWGAAALFGTSVGWGFVITNVSVGDNFFSPKALTISVNDQVKWTWTGSAQHSSTSNTGLWNSGLHGKGGTFSNTFTSAGTFPYHCTVHAGQTGTITVQAAAEIPPTVTILSPANGTVFNAPATFTITASASEPGGNIVSVEFFRDGTSIGITTASPYSQTVTNLPAGNYTCSAVATGSGGSNATNSISLVVVAPQPILLTAPLRISDTTFQLSFSTVPGLRYVVQRSTDLLNWTGISTNIAASNSFSFQDTNASPAAAFYRVGNVPSF